MLIQTPQERSSPSLKSLLQTWQRLDCRAPLCLRCMPKRELLPGFNTALLKVTALTSLLAISSHRISCSGHDALCNPHMIGCRCVNGQVHCVKCKTAHQCAVCTAPHVIGPSGACMDPPSSAPKATPGASQTPVPTKPTPAAVKPTSSTIVTTPKPAAPAPITPTSGRVLPPTPGPAPTPQGPVPTPAPQASAPVPGPVSGAGPGGGPGTGPGGGSGAPTPAPTPPAAPTPGYTNAPAPAGGTPLPAPSPSPPVAGPSRPTTIQYQANYCIKQIVSNTDIVFHYPLCLWGSHCT